MRKRLVIALVAAGLLTVASKAQTVVLTSDPPGSTIFLRGGVEVGQTPLSLQLLSGIPMAITSRWGLLEAVTATLIPVNGQTVVHRFVHEYGTLIIESDRDDAALKIDGEGCGNVPRILFLSPGRHRLFLTAANAPDKTREVEIKVGYRTSLRINFAGGSPETTITKGVSSPTATPAPSAAPKHGTKPKAPAEGLLVVARPGPGYR
jgi:hypothetical protein